MPEYVIHSTVDIYADNTLIYARNTDVNVTDKCLNEDMESIAKWLDNNHMKANVSQTYVAWDSNKQNQ